MMPETTIPLVSVAMITYGHEKYVAHSIEGVIAQKTNFPFELVIGTDCSPDKTDEIVAEYAAKYPDIIKIVSSESNVGARANGKRVRAACRGKYIAYCEGDDYWHDPNKLQMQVDIMEKDPEIGLVHTDIDAFEVNRNRRLHNINRIYGYRQKNVAPPRILDILTGAYNVLTCTVCARHELIGRTVAEYPELFDPKYKMGDVQQWSILATMCKFAYIDKSTATYNILQESASNSRDINKKIAFCDNAVLVLMHTASVLNIPKNDVKKLIEFNARRMLQLAVTGNNVELAEKYWLELKNNNCKISLTHFLAYRASKGRICKMLFKFSAFIIKFYLVTKREIRKLCRL